MKQKIIDRIEIIRHSSPFGLFILSFIIVYLIECFGRHSFFGGLEFLAASPFRYLASMFLVLTPFTVFYLFRRRGLGFAICTILWLAIGAVNGIVLAFRVTPFSVIDFRLWEDALMVVGKYFEKWQLVLLIVAIVALMVAIIFLLTKIKKYEGEMHRVRNAVLIVAYWLVMYFGFKAMVHGGIFSTTLPNLAYAYDDYGVSYCFVVTGMRNGIKLPIDYNESKMASIKKTIDKEFKDEDEAMDDVNVIFLQLESFFDINHVKNYYFSDNPLPYFTYLKENYSSGFLTVPAFGAGTANTGFEVMTGMNLNYFSPGEYPYKTILKKRTCESLAFDMLNLGYSTHAIHNNTATFYGRKTVFPDLGYQNFDTIETMWSEETTPTGWAKDKILTKEILDTLESTDTPDYIYTISVQGHGDYYKEEAQVDDPEVVVTSISGDASQESAVNYYVEQISEMDEFIEKLCTVLSNYDEKCMLVMYGDHLPGLGFTDEDLDNGDVFQTEYVIWDNFGLKKKDQDLNAYQLAAVALKKLHIHEGNVMRYHQRMMGKKGYEDGLKNIQYDLLYGDMYLYDQDNPLLQTDMTFGVGDVKITSVTVSPEKTFIYGKEFNQYSHVYIDGEEVEASLMSQYSLMINQELKDGQKIQVKQETSKQYVLESSDVYRYSASNESIESVVDE